MPFKNIDFTYTGQLIVKNKNAIFLVRPLSGGLVIKALGWGWLKVVLPSMEIATLKKGNSLTLKPRQKQK